MPEQPADLLPPRTTFTQDFRRFFLRGLGLLLPPILTVVILFYIWDFLDRRVGEPTNYLIRSGVAYFIQESRPTQPAGGDDEWIGLSVDPRTGQERPPFVPRKVYQEVRARTPSAEAMPTGPVSLYERYLYYEYWRRHWYLSLIGLIVAVVFVYFIGHFLATFIGNSIWRATEQTVFRLPIVRAVYPTIKEVSGFFLSDQKRSYNRVVAVEYPRRGIWSLGLVTGDAIGELEAITGQQLLTIFIPYTPYSVTGYTITAPRSEVIDLNVSVEDSIRFIMSGGLFRPAPKPKPGGQPAGRLLSQSQPAPAAVDAARVIRVGTRGSELARTQAEWVAGRLRELMPNRSVELVTIKTGGDRAPDARLREIGGEGLFTKEIQSALLNRDVDIAVHSLKDLPTTPVPGLALGAVPRRAPALDVFISSKYGELRSVPPGGRIGTSSPRRKSQLLRMRPDLVIEEIRGNVPTRIRKIEELGLSGIVLAHAGLQRLGLEEHITYRFSSAEMLPAPGQGALGIECRADDREALEWLAAIDDLPTRQATLAERTVLAALGGGCHMPLGAYAVVADDQLGLRVGVFALDGADAVFDSIAGPAAEAESLAQELAERLRSADVVRPLTSSTSRAI